MPNGQFDHSGMFEGQAVELFNQRRGNSPLQRESFSQRSRRGLRTLRHSQYAEPDDMESRQKIIYPEVTRLKGETVPAEDTIVPSSGHLVVLHSELLPSPTEKVSGSAAGLAQPASNDQGEDPEAMEMQADPAVLLVPRTRRVKLRRQPTRESASDERNS